MRVDLLSQIVLRWDSDSDCSGLLAGGGIDAVWFPSHNERIAAACRAAGADTLDADAIRCRSPPLDPPTIRQYPPSPLSMRLSAHSRRHSQGWSRDPPPASPWP